MHKNLKSVQSGRDAVMQKVLRTFPYSRDGVTIETLPAGREAEIRADLIEGLRAEGFVGPADATVAKPTPTSEPVTDSAATDAATSAEAVGGPPATDVVAPADATVVPDPVPGADTAPPADVVQAQAPTGVETPATTAVASDPAPAFDPATADVDALRAFLTSRNVTFHHKAGEAKLREVVAGVLAKA